MYNNDETIIGTRYARPKCVRRMRLQYAPGCISQQPTASRSSLYAIQEQEPQRQSRDGRTAPLKTPVTPPDWVLAADYFPMVAKRDPSDARPHSYETVRYGAHVKLDNTTNISLRAPSSEWVMCGEYSSDGAAQRTLRLVSAIPLECLIAARPRYWCDAQFSPLGHIKTALTMLLRP